MMSRALFAFLLLLISGCAGRQLPRFEERLERSDVMKLRTTAYTHTESDHKKYANRNALGTMLRTGEWNSAAADWSRWPAGTIFRIRATGELFIVDDYGWALAGTNTIDLYKPSKAAMREWGVRRVTIEILHWGDIAESADILRPRRKYRHVRRMLDQIERLPTYRSN